MPDIPFKFSFQPNNPAEHAARLAVLYRLIQPDRHHPRCPTDKEEWEEAFNRLLIRWRFRIWDFCQLGVYRFEPEKIQRARNGHP